MALKIHVLFVCVHNSARSQMAEAFLNHLAPDRFMAESAGIEPGRLNALVVSAMAETGLDISKSQTKSVAAMVQNGKRFDYVITVCDETSAERCPNFPGQARRLHWSFPDPSSVSGPAEEQMAAIRKIRDELHRKIESWIKSIL